jgi:RNA polymerase sigma-70 factor (ECF subfamily)
VLSAHVDGAVQQPPDGLESFEALIGALPHRARTALGLRYVEDLSYEDIARRLGCSPEAARQRVSTAVRTLRRRLA